MKLGIHFIICFDFQSFRKTNFSRPSGKNVESLLGLDSFGITKKKKKTYYQ